MKKYLLLFILSVYVTTAFADDKNVAVSETTNTPTKPRSVIQKPTASINTETFVLSVELLSSDTYTLRVLDAVGMEICQFTVISDGTRHPYSLPVLKNGSYTILIENHNRSYEGEFAI